MSSYRSSRSPISCILISYLSLSTSQSIKCSEVRPPSSSLLPSPPPTSSRSSPPLPFLLSPSPSFLLYSFLFEPPVPKDLPNHRSRQLPRREIRSHLLRGEHRGGQFHLRLLTFVQPFLSHLSLLSSTNLLRSISFPSLSLPSLPQIKPLTEEEKKARLDELRAKMAEKRATKGKQELEDNKANEALRRKAGKEQGDIKEDLKLKEANKEALERKRGESPLRLDSFNSSSLSRSFVRT